MNVLRQSEDKYPQQKPPNQELCPRCGTTLNKMGTKPVSLHSIGVTRLENRTVPAGTMVWLYAHPGRTECEAERSSFGLVRRTPNARIVLIPSAKEVRAARENTNLGVVPVAGTARKYQVEDTRRRDHMNNRAQSQNPAGPQATQPVVIHIHNAGPSSSTGRNDPSESEHARLVEKAALRMRDAIAYANTFALREQDLRIPDVDRISAKLGVSVKLAHVIYDLLVDMANNDRLYSKSVMRTIAGEPAQKQDPAPAEEPQYVETEPEPTFVQGFVQRWIFGNGSVGILPIGALVVCLLLVVWLKRDVIFGGNTFGNTQSPAAEYVPLEALATGSSQEVAAAETAPELPAATAAPVTGPVEYEQKLYNGGQVCAVGFSGAETQSLEALGAAVIGRFMPSLTDQNRDEAEALWQSTQVMQAITGTTVTSVAKAQASHPGEAITISFPIGLLKEVTGQKKNFNCPGEIKPWQP